MEQSRELFLIKQKDLPLFSGLLLPEAAACTGMPNILTAGVTNGELACGAASVEFDTEMGDILSFYVAKEERRQGAGRALMEGIAASAKRMGVKRLQVVCETAAVSAMGEFLSAMDFQCVQTIPRFRTTLEKLSGIQLPDALLTNVYPMKQLPEKALNDYNYSAQEPQNQFLKLNPEECDLALSSYCLTSDKRLGGFAAVARKAADQTELELINAYVSQECIKQMPALLRFCLKNAAGAFSPDTPVLLDAVTLSSEQLIRHLLQGVDVQESCVETFVRLL